MSAITGIAQAGNGLEMYAGRISAYDGLGQKMTKPIPAKDWEKVLNMANLNFHFHKTPVFDDEGTEVPEHRAVYRTVQGGPDDGKREFVGIVKMRHSLAGSQPDQLAAAAAAANPDGFYETIGLLKSSRLWVQMTGDTEFVLDPNGVSDRVRNIFTATTTFDGSGSIMFGDVDERWNCQNVINASMRGSSWQFKIRHTASAEDRIRQAVKAMAALRTRRVLVQETYSDLFAAKFTTKQFENLVLTLHTKDGKRPEDNVKGRLTKFENMMDSHMWAWNAPHNAGIRETAWGAWQSVLEVAQWGRKAQATDNGPANWWAAGAGFDGPTNDLRQRSLALVGARSGVKV